MAAHTPGQWKVLDHYAHGKHDGHLIVQDGDMGPKIVSLWHSTSINPCAELSEFIAVEDANAKLIAATPDLAHALDCIGYDCRQWIDGESDLSAEDLLTAIMREAHKVLTDAGREMSWISAPAAS